MIRYRESHWGISFIWHLKGSALPRASVWGVACAILSLVIHLTAVEYSAWPQEQVAKGSLDLQTDTLKVFTFAMSFALVMRAQTAFSRYREAATLLEAARGEWFNAISNLVAFNNQDPAKKEEVQRFQHFGVRLFSLLYGTALLQLSTMEDNSFEFISFDGFPKEDIEHLMSVRDSCEVVLQWIQRAIVDANSSGAINIAPPILSRVYNQLGNGIVKLSNARKIRDIPVPFPLAQLVTFMLLVFWFGTATIVGLTLTTKTGIVFVSFIATAPLWAINYMSVVLESPFGSGPNDLPMHEMLCDFNASLKSLCHPRTRRAPKYTLNLEEDNQLESKVYNFNNMESVRMNRNLFSEKEVVETEVPFEGESGTTLFREDQVVATTAGMKHPNSAACITGGVGLDVPISAIAALPAQDDIHKGDIETQSQQPCLQTEEFHLAAPPGFNPIFPLKAVRKERFIIKGGQGIFSSLGPVDGNTHQTYRNCDVADKADLEIATPRALEPTVSMQPSSWSLKSARPGLCNETLYGCTDSSVSALPNADYYPSHTRPSHEDDLEHSCAAPRVDVANCKKRDFIDALLGTTWNSASRKCSESSWSGNCAKATY